MSAVWKLTKFAYKKILIEKCAILIFQVQCSKFDNLHTFARLKTNQNCISSKFELDILLCILSKSSNERIALSTATVRVFYTFHSNIGLGPASYKPIVSPSIQRIFHIPVSVHSENINRAIHDREAKQTHLHMHTEHMCVSVCVCLVCYHLENPSKWLV